MKFSTLLAAFFAVATASSMVPSAVYAAGNCAHLLNVNCSGAADCASKRAAYNSCVQASKPKDPRLGQKSTSSNKSIYNGNRRGGVVSK